MKPLLLSSLGPAFLAIDLHAQMTTCRFPRSQSRPKLTQFVSPKSKSDSKPCRTCPFGDEWPSRDVA